MWNDALDAKGEKGVQELFLNMINQGLGAYGREALSPDLIKDLSVREVTSASASEIAGTKITRPVLIFNDVKSFKRFYGALTGAEEAHWDQVSSRGFNTEMNVQMADGTNESVTLIVAPLQENHIAHEVRHTIDPYLLDRKGYDRLLCELFAYYTDVTESPRAKEKPERIWDDLIAAMWGDDKEGSYYKEYSTEAENSISWIEYGKLVKQASQKLKELVEKNGHIEAQRKAVSSRTLEEFFKLA